LAEQAIVNAYELNAMDRWLTAIGSDNSRRGAQSKVIADKPADLGDGCYVSTTQRLVAPVTDPATGPCAAAYPVAVNPRLNSGESLSMNVLKCALTPLNFASYAPITFTAAEKAQLRAAFPTGVCDYHRPGVGQRSPIAPWLSYGDERTGLTPPTPIPPVEDR
jgi:hypothetical protein